MPKNKFQEVIFTIIMVFVMVYAMICYNIVPVSYTHLKISLPCVSTPAGTFLVLRTLLNCLDCIIYKDCYS